ncbi:MAG: 5'/3'-nucleotidase SurE [Dehalococcoidia bacterium]
MPRTLLITNDDGIDSTGLWTLVEAAAATADYTYVVAPATNQSAVGGAFTLHRELHWEQVTPRVAGVEAWTVDGTPSDCVAIALGKVVSRPIDAVLSGINFGANVGRDVLASGTVGGAMQGHLSGYTAIAFSQPVGDPKATQADIDWSVSADIVTQLCQALVDGTVRQGSFLNVNVPRVPRDQLAGMLVTRMGRASYIRLMELREAGTGVFEREADLHTHPDLPPGTDIWALLHNYVSVTPLHSNLTDHRLIDALGDSLNAAWD